MEMFLPILFVLIKVVGSFYTRQPPHWRTKTHVDITNAGIRQAIAQYIIDLDLTNSTDIIFAIDDFFGKDKNGKTEMGKAIFAVKSSISDTQEDKRNVAYVHCHADLISLAHKHVIACREGLLPRKDNLYELRRHIGVCLYTIQSFYSNTNWVEMNGRVPYDDFGIKGRQLMDVATQDEDTCRDMPDIDRNCKNNILVTDKLTSGYHHGRGNVKPPRPLGSTTGKCSHGGPDDESRKLIAKCGINKETTIERLSPHYHLHNDAYIAAVEATKRFFIAEDTGILNLLGNETFRSLFQLKQRKQTSLAFALDYSGSMSDEIAAVKEKITQLVYSTLGSINEPVDYVLSLFNDPLSLNQAFVFTEGSEIIKKVSDIVVTGGGDCPEYAAAGVLKAIELSRKGSTVFLFTDADAKDRNRGSEIAQKARAKNIKITPILTGSCSKRKRRDTKDRYYRATDFYDEMAIATGGTVYRTNKTNIGVIINEVVENVFPTLEVIIGTNDWPATMGTYQDVIVDGSIQMLKVSIKEMFSLTTVELLYPNGTNVQLNSPTASSIFTSKREIIMSLQNLPPGIYKLHKTIKINAKVNITAQSTVQVESEMLQRASSGSLISIKGSPIVGNNYTYSFTVFNFGNGTCDSIVLVGTDGHVLYDYSIKQTNNSDTTCTADIAIPNETFQVILNGTDTDGHPFQRATYKIYKPTSVELRVDASLDEVSLNQETYIPYEIINTGQVRETYKVLITDDHSFATEPLSHLHTIDPGESANGSFTLLPDSVVGLAQFTLILTQQYMSDIKQRISKSFVVTYIQRPICNVMTTSGVCSPPSLNTANCSLYKWSADISVNFSNTRLDTISSTGGNIGVLGHDDITDLDTGPVAANASGDCCVPSVTISVVDVDGYISQCHLDFSDGKPVLPVQQEEEKTSNTGSTQFKKTLVGMIIAMAILFGFH